MLPNGPFSIDPTPFVANGSIAMISPSTSVASLCPGTFGIDLPAWRRYRSIEWPVRFDDRLQPPRPDRLRDRPAQLVHGDPGADARDPRAHPLARGPHEIVVAMAPADLDRIGGVGDRAVQMGADVDLDEVPGLEPHRVVGARRVVGRFHVPREVDGERGKGALAPDVRLDRVRDLPSERARNGEAEPEVARPGRDARRLAPPRKVVGILRQRITSGGRGGGSRA